MFFVVNNNKISLFEPVHKNFNLDINPIYNDSFDVTLYLGLHDELKFTIETEFNQLNVEIDEIQKM